MVSLRPAVPVRARLRGTSGGRLAADLVVCVPAPGEVAEWVRGGGADEVGVDEVGDDAAPRTVVAAVLDTE